jgi:hypothetical protein
MNAAALDIPWPTGDCLQSPIGDAFMCCSAREGHLVNHKRLFRLYREEKLTVRKRGGRKRAIGTRAPMLIPMAANDRWSLDFVSDQQILMQARPMHELLVSAMDESWAIMKTHVQKLVDIFEAVIREGLEMSELQPQDAAGSAQAMMAAFMPFFHPVLVEQCVRHDCNTEPALQAQINFIMKALGRSDRAA